MNKKAIYKNAIKKLMQLDLDRKAMNLNNPQRSTLSPGHTLKAKPNWTVKQNESSGVRN